MKKIIAIAFAAIIAGLAISCQKEESVSDKTDAVQYTFNITVSNQAGFDNDASTKGGSFATYKTGWENKDRIFLFFKPTDGSLLDDTYATLTYNGSSWDGTVTPGQSSLGDGGTLSAVYVYKLDGSVTPAYSDNKWTIATGNTFYNCQTGVDYTVSDNVISASLNLVAPTDFVQFYVSGGATGALTCDKVKGWKDVAIGSDMSVSNAICTGYMEGFANSGDQYVREYYGRIVSGTSLNGVECNFSVVKDGKVYERTATPTTDARSFKMMTTSWTEAYGKLPGLFTVGNGADGKAGTEDDVQVRFSKGNLWYGPATEGAPATFNFEANQYSISSSWDANHVSNFYWSKTASVAYADSYNESGTSEDDVFFTNATGFTVGGQTNVWRTLSHDEWKYLFDHHTYKYVSVNGKHGIVIAPDEFSGTIEDSYEGEAWATAESNGFVFLPSTGYRSGLGILEKEGDKISCIYWTSTASGLDDDNPTAYRTFFQWNKDTPLSKNFETGLREWAVGIRLVSD